MTTATIEGVSGRERPLYARTGVLGLLLVTAAILLIGVAAAVQAPEELGFFAVIIAVAAIASVVTWRGGTWGKVVGIVVTLAAAVAMFWLAFGLAFPASFMDFVPAVTFVTGVVLGIGGNVAALRAGRKHRTTIVATPRERRIERGALLLVVAAMVVSGALFFLGRESVDPAAAAGATRVEMANFAFAPAELEVGPAGTVLVHNSDAFAHDIAVPALGIGAVVVLPGNDALISLGSDVAPGRYDYYCTLHASTSDPAAEAGMAGTLIVP